MQIKGDVFDARLAAARILEDIERKSAYADALLDSALGRAAPPAREAALCTTLVYGVLRYRYRLDKFIEAGAKRPVKKVHPKVLNILRIAAFQLLTLDRIPASAAVDQAVKMAVSNGQGHAKGFVNAVLRRIAEGITPEPPTDEAEALALEYSLPPWLARKWLDQEGPEGAKLLAAQSLKTPPIFFRVDTRTASREEVLDSLGEAKTAGLGFYAPESLWLTGAASPRKLNPVIEGLMVVQGQASQLIAPLLNPRPGMRILDACAAPGMKSLQLARLMEDEGEVVALDIHEHKINKLKETASHLSFSSLRPLKADATTFDDPDGFDGVLVDAPCTGLGVLAKNPERKWRADPDDPARLAKLQTAILENVCRLVKPGGFLVYATCTTSIEENDGVADGFLAAHPEFEPVAANLPSELSDGKGGLKTYPHDDGGDPGRNLDSFFAAVFRRR